MIFLVPDISHDKYFTHAEFESLIAYLTAIGFFLKFLIETPGELFCSLSSSPSIFSFIYISC